MRERIAHNWRALNKWGLLGLLIMAIGVALGIAFLLKRLGVTGWTGRLPSVRLPDMLRLFGVPALRFGGGMVVWLGLVVGAFIVVAGVPLGVMLGLDWWAHSVLQIPEEVRRLCQGC